MAREGAFAFRVADDDAAIWERIVADPRVRVSDAPAPEPGPPVGQRFLAARSGELVRVRHWAGPADAVSPVVVLQLHREGEVTRVHGRIEQPRVSRDFAAHAPTSRWWMSVLPMVVLAGIAVVAYLVAGSSLLWALPMLLLLFAIPSSAVMLPALALWNAEVRREQRRALRDWVGQTFVPIALPAAEDDDPFR
ncbi:MAG TPA: hypothetical protein VG755_29120 [Nannocystaceae bacterium]|nr:hypothetical protein [Nannocystaceae bacterium]